MTDFKLDPTVCCIKHCDKPVEALGLCVNHWRLNRKYGSPVARKVHSGMFLGKPPEERFWMQVNKVDGECWLWSGGTDKDGYGIFDGATDGVSYARAHRFSFALHHGHPPKGRHVCHTCDTPKCVNPDHLFAGTDLDNMRDKIAKGRSGILMGVELPQAVLTEDDARAILNDPRSYAAIAAQYGVAVPTISSLKNRQSWKHVDGEAVKPKRVSARRGVSDKITPDIVRDIRSSAERGTDIAKRLGISPQTICGIRKRRSWAHIE